MAIMPKDRIYYQIKLLACAFHSFLHSQPVCFQRLSVGLVAQTSAKTTVCRYCRRC